MFNNILTEFAGMEKTLYFCSINLSPLDEKG